MELNILTNRRNYAQAETNSPSENKQNSNKEDDIKLEQYKYLVHWARMSTTIEGCIEAPIQFLFQVR